MCEGLSDNVSPPGGARRPALELVGPVGDEPAGGLTRRKAPAARTEMAEEEVGQLGRIDVDAERRSVHRIVVRHRHGRTPVRRSSGDRAAPDAEPIDATPRRPLRSR